MPYGMMGGQMGPGNNMRLPGPQRNAGMQQIPPSGPMMRAQVKCIQCLEIYNIQEAQSVCSVSVMSYK